MALDRKKKQKKVSLWKLAADKKPFDSKLFKKNPEEPLLIHRKLKIK